MNDLHFVWTEDISVGEKTIDTQHKELLAQLNKIIDAFVFGGTSNETKEALNFFEEYVQQHLIYEEEYMQKHSYSDLEAHKKIHQNYRDKYASFRKKLESGISSDTVLIEMEKFLAQWWVEHIKVEDKKYFLAIGKM